MHGCDCSGYLTKFCVQVGRVYDAHGKEGGDVRAREEKLAQRKVGATPMCDARNVCVCARMEIYPHSFQVSFRLSFPGRKSKGRLTTDTNVIFERYTNVKTAWRNAVIDLVFDLWIFFSVSSHAERSSSVRF